MRIRGVGTVSALVLAVGLAWGQSSAQAHEIKVLASKLVAQPGDSDTVYLSWGHILPVDVPIEADAIDTYQLHTPSGSVRYLATDGYSLQANDITVDEQGLYQAEATRKPAIFTVMIDEQGNHQHVMAPKSEAAERAGEIDHAARSHQFAKALLVSGDVHEPADEPLGHPFEIVTLDGPESWRAGEDIRVQVLFDGKPATRQDVFARFIGFKPDRAWCYAIQTDNQGQATIHVDRPGTWVFRARKIRPAAEADRDQFDFETYTATMALEVLP